MRILPSSQPEEIITLKVDHSLVWELVLGIAAYTHIHLQQKLGLENVQSMDKNSMSPSLLRLLNKIKKTKFWYGLILLQARFSADSVQEFLDNLNDTPSEALYEILLPYKNQQTEPLRKLTAKQLPQSNTWKEYAALFEKHEYLNEYILHLQSIQIKEVHNLLTNILLEWEIWISQRGEWKKWLQVLAFEQKQYTHLDSRNPIAEIERVTEGIEYVPEPSIWKIIMIPQVSCRPWAMTIRTFDTKFIFYPVKEEHLLVPGVPPNELLLGHKALGDEVRLKLLFQLQKKELSLNELSIQFNILKSTLHHHLAILKEANFVFVEKGNYSINYNRIEDFSRQLTHYLKAFE